MADLNPYWFDSKSSGEVAQMVARAAEKLGTDTIQALLPAPLTLVIQLGEVKSVAIILAAEGKQQIPAWQGNSGAARSTDLGLNKEVDFVAPVLQKFFETTRDVLGAGVKEADAKAATQASEAQSSRADAVEFYRTQVEAIPLEVQADAAAAGAATGNATVTNNDAEHDPA